MANINERAELHKTIWQIANDLRGSVDGWDFKNYVLGFLFYRFISEDQTAHLNRLEAEAGNEGFDYARDVTDDDIDDDIRHQTIDEKGYFINPSELFQNVLLRAESDNNLNETLARIACSGKGRISRVYDPACGSGSLLLKFVKVLGPERATQVSFYGQEINITTYNLCRINMFLHHVPFNKFDIQLGDTLTGPKHLADQPFDAIVSNPPYSTHWAGDSNPLLINDDRYSPAGVLAPKTKADLAFTMHMLHHLSTTGTAAIVEFPGVLYRGGAEQKIRQFLIENNYVDSVIQLPANLFFGVGIATCIIVLKKSKADNSVLFIDAGKDCVKDGNKNKLTSENIDTIFNTYVGRRDVDYKSRLVNNKDILANDCNLSVSSYVKQEDTREQIDIAEVNTKLASLIAEGNELNQKIEAIVKELEG